MRIEELKIDGFRNLQPTDLRIDAATVLVVGDNAQGKTNLLEAVYLCATGRSFRGAAAKELVAADQARARAEARFVQRGVRHDVQLDWAAHGPSQSLRQRLQLDGRGLRQASELLSLLQVVAFFPEDLAIAKAGPEARRRFVDRAVAGGRPSFVQASLAYQRALKARNALLRGSGESGLPALVAAYDEVLAKHGAHVHVVREMGLAELWPHAQATFAQLMPQTSLGWRWHTGFGAVPDAPALAAGAAVEGGQQAQREGHVAAHLRELWRTTYAQDRARGMTLRGPHRGDLLAELSGKDARLYASQGQQRCLVLALKVAELKAIAERLGNPPLLLLDDVSSELDQNRLERLFSWVQTLGAQTWISTTGSVPLPLPVAKQTFRVQAGQVEPQAS